MSQGRGKEDGFQRGGSVTSCCIGVRKSTEGCEFKYAAPTEVEWEGEEWRDVLEACV